MGSPGACLFKLVLVSCVHAQTGDDSARLLVSGLFGAGACVSACACVCACMFMCMFKFLYACTYVCMYVCMYVCTHVCVCVCVCVWCVCTFVYLNVIHVRACVNGSVYVCGRVRAFE
jgi:hypothetical protein